MMALCLVSPHKAFAIDFPGDSPTIEALINLHKLIKSEEDDAMARIATSFGEQSLVTKGAKAFNDARTTLDSKLNNAYSYVLFAAASAGRPTAFISSSTNIQSSPSLRLRRLSASRWWHGTMRKRTLPVPGS